MIGLTAKQQELLTYIESYLQENDGVSPSFDQMADALNLASKSGVHRLVCGLEQRGAIRRLPHHARSIQILAETPYASPSLKQLLVLTPQELRLLSVRVTTAQRMKRMGAAA